MRVASVGCFPGWWRRGSWHFQVASLHLPYQAWTFSLSASHYFCFLSKRSARSGRRMLPAERSALYIVRIILCFTFLFVYHSYFCHSSWWELDGEYQHQTWDRIRKDVTCAWWWRYGGDDGESHDYHEMERNDVILIIQMVWTEYYTRACYSYNSSRSSVGLPERNI